MYLHDPCGFDPTYTRSQSPSGPATTPQNGSSCGTLDFWRNSGGTSKKMTAARAYGTGNSAKIWTPEGPGTHNPILSESEFTPAHAQSRNRARSLPIKRLYTRGPNRAEAPIAIVGLGACAIEVREAERGCARSLAAISASARTLLWSRTERALSSLQRLAPLSCSGPTTRTLPFSCRGRTSACGVVQPMGGVALIPPPIAQCSLLLRWALPVPGVDAGFYKRMRSSLNKKTRTARSPPEFVFCRHWPAAGETQPGPLSGNRGGGPTSTCSRGGPTSTRPAPSSAQALRHSK
ncbi:hypothetical protein H6P81_021164 [Aristolochia fimbriata]|uniref:Uncharacterized protein n=1 Tax=Aristolochia fimbriata TaxID=158543 RepID=A0AAV7DTK6_ARIFI|nr:hypothetical protein H6P81_021164 [Aristolochia fimbriata]